MIFLRSQPDSELRSFLDKLGNPSLAESILRQVKADLTTRDLAEIWGVSEDTIERWKRKGCPYEGINGVASRYYLPDVCKWVAGQKVIHVGDSEGEQLERKLKEEKLRSAKLSREQKEGRLVNVNNVERAMLDVVSMWRNRMEHFHRQFGDDVIEASNEIADEISDAIHSEFQAIKPSGTGDRTDVDDPGDTETEVPDDGPVG